MEDNSINSPTDENLIYNTKSNSSHKTTNMTDKIETKDENVINIILKSIQNSITNMKINRNSMIKNEISNILKNINNEINESSHDIKLIFGGKILQQNTTFSSNGIKEGHTLLYMLKEKENKNSLSIGSSTGINSEMSRNVSLLVENTEQSIINANNNLNQAGQEGISNDVNSNIDLRTLVTTQGFSRFREYGVSPEEIHMMRVMFHTNFMINNRNAPRSSWSPQEVIRREEDWVQQVHNQQNLQNDSNLNVQVPDTNNQNVSLARRQIINEGLLNLMNRARQNENSVDGVYNLRVSLFF